MKPERSLDDSFAKLCEASEFEKLSRSEVECHVVVARAHFGENKTQHEEHPLAPTDDDRANVINIIIRVAQ